MLAKRSAVFCGYVMKGIALHFKYLEIFGAEGLLSSKEKKIAYNKFSHYQRPDRTAGDKLAVDITQRHNLQCHE